MSRYPSAQWRPIRDTSTRALTKDILCLHTGIGGGLGIWSYFDRLDIGVYSHGIVCGIWGSDAGKNVDGLALQMADTDYRAAANLDGNWRVISWETGDNATRPIAPWTKKQCDTIVRIMVDAHRLDGIPLVLIPDTKPGRRGIAYHRLGVDPYRVDGGELWSTAYGKDCPTDPRIDQIPGLIDRARAIVAGNQEDWMTTPISNDNLDAIADAVNDKLRETLTYNLSPRTVGRALTALLERSSTEINAVAAVRAAVDAVRADQAVSGDREEKALALLAEIEAGLPEPAPEPTA